MKNPFPVFNLRFGNPDFEVRVVRWIIPALGLATIYLMAVRFPQLAHDRVELGLCILGALLMFLVLALGITLSIPLQKAATEGSLRSRSIEYLSYAASVTLLISGILLLPTLGFVREGDIRVGLMLLISTCGVILSLGMLTSLLRASKV